ncbi:MAG: apolipoprotein N-acyltransferase [Phycisphaerae bacterium]
MGKMRHTLNPAKVKRDAQALEGAPPKPPVTFLPGLRRRATATLLGLLTVTLLSVSFAPADVWPLAYVGLVPWMLGLTLAPTRRWSLFSGWLAGLVFWAVSLYWLTWITLVGYVAGILYLSVYWLIAAAILRAAMLRRWPMWIILPIVWVALEYVRAHAGPAFPWFFLAHTQYAQTRLIQIADTAGQYGVSFFVAMVNGAAVDLAASLLPAMQAAARRPRSRLVRAATATIVTTAVVLLYGTWQLSRETQSTGPAIGIVQRAFPISLSGRAASPEEMLNSHLAGTAEFVTGKLDLDLVIWPETMLPRGLNAEVLGADVGKLAGDRLRALAGKFFGSDVWRKDLSDESIRAYLQPYIEGGVMPHSEEVVGLRFQAARITHIAGRLGCPILAGGASLHADDDPVSRDDWWVVRNGALWFDPNEAYGPVYAKRHLVPFSEYVPFKRSWPGLHRLLRAFVPSVMEQLDPGPGYTRFELSRPSGKWKLVSPICYEGTFAGVCRDMVYDGGQKRADIIANLSNDGWFVYRRGDGPYRGSTEHAQHLSHYCFRAVENRVPVVRAVNTGISASIDSNGRIAAEVRHRSIRTMIPGTLALDGARRNDVEYLPGHGPKVLVDSRTSWYSRLGDVFAVAVSMVAAALVAQLAWKRLSDREGAKN